MAKRSNTPRRQRVSRTRATAHPTDFPPVAMPPGVDPFDPKSIMRSLGIPDFSQIKQYTAQQNDARVFVLACSNQLGKTENVAVAIARTDELLAAARERFGPESFCLYVAAAPVAGEPVEPSPAPSPDPSPSDDYGINTPAQVS